MADETTLPVNASSNDPQKRAVTIAPQMHPAEPALPEPTILEEHIVRHAAPAVQAVPVPERPAEIKVPTPSAPDPAPVPETVPTLQKPVEPLQPPTRPETILPPKVAAPPQPAVTRTPPAQATFEPAYKPIRDDIARILGEIKIPERLDFKARGDAHAPPIELKPILEEPDAVEAAPPKPAQNSPRNSERPTSVVTPVHTLKDDLQGIVRDKKISVVRATALEMDKRRGQEHFVPRENEAQKHRSRRTRGILFAAGILFVLGIAALSGVFFIESQQSAVPAATSQSGILFAEQTVSFPLGNQSPHDVKQLLAQARVSGGGALGSITQIVPTVPATDATGNATQRPATLSEFLSALGANPPADLTRSLSTGFFFGIHTVDVNAPVFVIPVVSYDHAFADMLEWEPTMNADLSPVFTAVPALTTDANGLPTARTFVDGVLRNYDARELKDDSGNIEMYYSFPTPNILIIAESPYSFTEILSRLQAERKL